MKYSLLQVLMSRTFCVSRHVRLFFLNRKKEKDLLV